MPSSSAGGEGVVGGGAGEEAKGDGGGVAGGGGGRGGSHPVQEEAGFPKGKKKTYSVRWIFAIWGFLNLADILA